MYKTSFRTQVKTSNHLVVADGYSSIVIINKGQNAITVNDNILIEPTKSWRWKNDPDVIVELPIYVQFDPFDPTPKCIIEQYYFQKQ